VPKARPRIKTLPQSFPAHLFSVGDCKLQLVLPHKMRFPLGGDATCGELMKVPLASVSLLKTMPTISLPFTLPRADWFNLEAVFTLDSL
jgi:hypothetical protein